MMNRLSKAQIDYAERRLNGAFSERKEVLRESQTTGEPLTSERRAILLRQGKVKMFKRVTAINNYTDVTDAFDFSPFEEKFNEKKYIAGCLKLDKEKMVIMDKLMLGDTEEALTIIDGLE